MDAAETPAQDGPAAPPPAAPLPADAATLAAWVVAGHARALARALSWAENAHPQLLALLEALQGSRAGAGAAQPAQVVGITGPPGAGKSTLADGLTSYYVAQGKRVALLAIDPTSPFNFGALLGDRIRLSKHFLDAGVFIRSMASRGSLGGLSASAVQATDVLRAAPFDVILVETVGVGQSEVEIAGLADTTVVVLVPEGGDDVQGLKNGIMEIADLFVVNKADRPGAAAFAAGLRRMLHERPATPGLGAGAEPIAVIEASASQGEGIEALAAAIEAHGRRGWANGHGPTEARSRRAALLLDKALALLAQRALAPIDRQALMAELEGGLAQGAAFNFYAWLSGTAARLGL